MFVSGTLMPKALLNLIVILAVCSGESQTQLDNFNLQQCYNLSNITPK